MKIKKIISQSRRDLTAEYECEHCGYIYEGYGYDNSHFHRNVIPNIECPKCKLKTHNNYRALTIKYSDDKLYRRIK